MHVSIFISESLEGMESHADEHKESRSFNTGIISNCQEKINTS